MKNYNLTYDTQGMLELVTCKDCKELKQLITDNPEAPLLIFCGDDANTGDYSYESQPSTGGSLKEVVLVKDSVGGTWMEKDDYEEWVADTLCENVEETKDMSNDEYFALVKKVIEDTEFIKAICVYVG